MAQLRLRVATDNPGSPNIQAGLAQISGLHARSAAPSAPTRISTACRFPAAAPSTAPSIPKSKLTDGTSTTNDDRNFNQYGGVGRISYDLLPGLKPFGEIEGDSRVHDLPFDRNGYRRNSTGGYAKAGTSFEFSRLLTGEISLGYAMRNYVDPRLDRLQGLLVASSLIWTATPLTTAQILSTTSIDETTRARRLRRADAHLYLRGRSRFSPLAHRDRQIHLRHLRISGRRSLRQDLLASRAT